MGCDIHAFAEIKLNGKWHNYSALEIDRNYLLFAKLAGVRDHLKEVEHIAEPKGMPDCPSEVVQMECDKWGTDGHSHSWLSSQEIETLKEWLIEHNKTSPYKIDLSLPYHIQYTDELENIEDVRLVFWFDN